MAKISYNNIVNCPWTFSQIKKIVKQTQKFERRLNREIEINIIGEKEMIYLNKTYHGKNGLTDVLSFAWIEEKTIKSKIQGQIYICFEQIKKQAKKYKISSRQEFARILIHGLLHLSLHDHRTKQEENKMFKLQEKILCYLYPDC